MSMRRSSTAEDEFFLREEAEKLKQLAQANNKKLEQQEKERLKELHHKRCPGCGMELSTLQYRGIKIEKCVECKGVFMEDADFLLLAGEEENSLISTLSNMFR